MIEMDERENWKVSRVLAWGAILGELRQGFRTGKHFVWLEKNGWDVGVLLTFTEAKNIVAVTDDADLAMEVQEKYEDVNIVCGNPLDVVRAHGRAFSSMGFGFHRTFNKKYFDDFTQLLQLGIKDQGCFFLVINEGDPEGEAMLSEGYEGMSGRMRVSSEMSDIDVFDEYYKTSSREEQQELRAMLADETSYKEGLTRARAYITRCVASLSKLADADAKVRAQIRGFAFLNYFRDHSWQRKFGPLPYEFITIEDKRCEEFPIVFGARIMRGKPGESAEKFSRRLSTAANNNPKAEIRYAEDKDNRIKEFYEGNAGKARIKEPFPWEFYFSVTPETVEEWRKTWLTEVPTSDPSEEGSQ